MSLAAANRRQRSPWAGAALVCLALLFAIGALPEARAEPVRTPHVTAELIAERAAVQPGQRLMVGLRMQHIAHWHTYWRNPGDSGLPTALVWTLPAGSRMGEILWPAPKRLPVGPLLNYGYEGDLLLAMPFTAPADARPGDSLVLQAKADWLVCKEVCIPETVSLSLAVPVVDAQTSPAASPEATHFVQAAALLPTPLQGWRTELQRAGSEMLLTFAREGAAPAAGPGAPPIEVFPFDEQLLVPARHELHRTNEGYAVKLALQEGAKLPDAMRGVAVAQGQFSTAAPAPWGDARPAVEFEAPLRTVAALEWPAGARRLEGSPTEGAASGPATSRTGLAGALLFALLGGMLLNLMPCVFPVLSIKLLSLAQQHTEGPALRTHAWSYGAGVVASFLALAAALLALRAAGEAVGWGFQLQEPGFVFVLAVLFFAIGLNLSGGFEVSQWVPARLAEWRSRRPAADAFGAGVLAVVAASPCTAPFMGAALGFALGQSAPIGLATFAALGVGMALPYIALVMSPGWRARLPRPGPWMQHLRQGLAFPMFATVVWLLWVMGQQAGIDAVARALLALIAVGMFAWLASLHWSRGAIARTLGAAALVLVLVWSWPVTSAIDAAATPAGTRSDKLALAASPADARQAEGTAPVSADPWQPYDEIALAQHLAQGRNVFVDFTAAWCITCQVNKKLVLGTASTLQAFAEANVVLMRADWTRRDERITAALARLGRNGVPMYALMSAGRETVLLPEILTEGLVREALATLASPRS